MQVPKTDCLCQRADPEYICQMHLKSGKGKYYDTVADDESNRPVPRNSKHGYRLNTKDTIRKRQTVELPRKSKGKAH